jgi:hypothetical protein
VQNSSRELAIKFWADGLAGCLPCSYVQGCFYFSRSLQSRGVAKREIVFWLVPHLTHRNMTSPSKLAQASMLLICLREVPGSNVAFETVFIEILRSFTQSLQEMTG